MSAGLFVFVFEEVALRFKQVAGLEHHRLGFVEYREVEHAGFCAALLVHAAITQVEPCLRRLVEHRVNAYGYAAQGYVVRVARPAYL